MESGVNMRLSVRLANETISGIKELKKFYEKNNPTSELRITNGATVGLALRELKQQSSLEEYDWESIIFGNQFLDKNQKAEKSDIKTNLTLADDVVDDINKLKDILPSYTKTNYVTTSYVIRIIVRATLKKNDFIK
ncbi:hypothetical protein [Lactococcus lactis]|uniref:hypothetical protein n=1 Tax=Lactococcus lactis TaxID=1358 RepID=UPI003DA88BD0